MMTRTVALSSILIATIVVAVIWESYKSTEPPVHKGVLPVETATSPPAHGNARSVIEPETADRRPVAPPDADNSDIASRQNQPSSVGARTKETQSIAVLSRKLAKGVGLDEIADASLRQRVESKLAETDRDFAESQQLLIESKEREFKSRLDKEQFRKLTQGQAPTVVKGALVSGLRYLRDGTPVEIIVMPGDSPELDDASAMYSAVVAKRAEAVRRLLEEGKSNQQESKR